MGISLMLLRGCSSRVIDIGPLEQVLGCHSSGISDWEGGVPNGVDALPLRQTTDALMTRRDYLNSATILVVASRRCLRKLGKAVVVSGFLGVPEENSVKSNFKKTQTVKNER